MYREQMQMKKRIMHLLVLMPPCFALAERNKEDYKSVRSIDDYSRPSGTGLTFYLGLDGGLVYVVPKNDLIESDKNGTHFGAKGMFSLVTNKMAVDIGVINTDL